MKNIGIIGCGWLGIQLAKRLSPEYNIYTTTTSERKKIDLTTMGYNPIVMQFDDSKICETNKKWEFLEQLDVIIITVPFSKQATTETLQNRFENICLFIENFKNQLFLTSSIGIYPQVQMQISEKTIEEKLLNPSILFVEKRMKEAFPQINILRLGGLMGGNRIFSNYEISTPNQIVNHVHYEDCCLIIKKMIAENIHSKIYNVVAPLHPTKQEIINYQKGITITDIQGNGREIISDLLQNELNYTYLHPNPKTFK
ncbi:MAG: epimerase [Capnocytophaga sp.]|nr:epimerase [Capnocytophaga sp.]